MNYQQNKNMHSAEVHIFGLIQDTNSHSSDSACKSDNQRKKKSYQKWLGVGILSRQSSDHTKRFPWICKREQSYFN